MIELMYPVCIGGFSLQTFVFLNSELFQLVCCVVSGRLVMYNLLNGGEHHGRGCF